MDIYIKTTLEEARRLVKSDATVLVSVQDLEKDDCNVEFERKKFYECSNLIERAETIAKVCNEFANELRCFSHIQDDLYNITPKGEMSTILYHGSKHMF